MGQKSNPKILRLGKVKEWKIKYFEKKSTELPLYSFYSLELEKFITKFFAKHGLTVENCVISISEASLHIFVSYVSNPHLSFKIGTLTEQKKIKLKFDNSVVNKKQNLLLLKRHKNHILYNKKLLTSNFSNNSQKFLFKQLYLENRYKKVPHLFSQKTRILLDDYKNIHNFKTNAFLNKITTIVYNFTGKKLNSFLTLEKLNNNFNYKEISKNMEKKKLNSSLTELRKFQKNDFFKAGITLAYTCVRNQDSSKLIANYLKVYLTKVKRPNFFLRFLKNILDLFIKKKFSNLKQIQIKIKGRLNGVPRAKSKTIKIGKGIPMLTLNSSIDFSKETAFTPNGTLGIKVWTYKKL